MARWDEHFDMRPRDSTAAYDLRMEYFDDSIKSDFPEHNTPNDIEAALDTLYSLKVAECDGIALSPVSKLPAQVIILLQVGLRRTIELAEAAIREINRRHLVTSSQLCRGTLETSCLLWDVMRQVERLAESGDTANVKELIDTLTTSLLGGKAKGIMLDDAILARNVLTIIGRLSKHLSVPLDHFYAMLSEYAHPNYHGMMATYTQEGFKDGATKVFCDRRSASERSLLYAALGSLATSCSIVIESYRIAGSRLEAVAELAERDIYVRGEWPVEVPYPVDRG
jgi:hypothetical protein